MILEGWIEWAVRTKGITEEEAEKLNREELIKEWKSEPHRYKSWNNFHLLPRFKADKDGQ